MLVNQNMKLLKTKGQKQDGYQTLTGQSSEYPVGLSTPSEPRFRAKKPLSYHITERESVKCLHAGSLHMHRRVLKALCYLPKHRELNLRPWNNGFKRERKRKKKIRFHHLWITELLLLSHAIEPTFFICGLRSHRQS